MARETRTYSPDKVSLIISGYVVSGITEMSLEFNTDAFIIQRGIRGQNSRSYNSDSSARLTVEVLQTSPTNDILFQIVKQDRGNKSARLDLVLSDLSGHTILQSDSAYIANYPNIRLSSGFNPRVWTFDMLRITDSNFTGATTGPDSIFSDVGNRIVSAVTGLF